MSKNKIFGSFMLIVGGVVLGMIYSGYTSSTNPSAFLQLMLPLLILGIVVIGVGMWGINKK